MLGQESTKPASKIYNSELIIVLNSMVMVVVVVVIISEQLFKFVFELLLKNDIFMGA